MPGVVFAPKRTNYLDLALQQLMGGAIGQMFDRDAKAREFNNNLRAAEEAERLRQEGVVADMNNKWDFSTNTVDPYLQGRQMVDPNDPNVDFKTGAFLDSAGMSDSFRSIYPHAMSPQEFKTIDTGDQVQTGSYNTRTGKFTQGSSYEKGYDPDSVLAEDGANMRYQMGLNRDYDLQEDSQQHDFDLAAFKLANEPNKAQEFASQEYAAAQRDYQYALDMGDDVGAAEAKARMEEIRSRGQEDLGFTSYEVTEDTPPAGYSAPDSVFTDSPAAGLVGVDRDFYGWLVTEKGMTPEQALNEIRKKQQGVDN